jgi:hypothetical protein
MTVRFVEAPDGHNWENWPDRLRNALAWIHAVLRSSCTRERRPSRSAICRSMPELADAVEG